MRRNARGSGRTIRLNELQLRGMVRSLMREIKYGDEKPSRGDVYEPYEGGGGSVAHVIGNTERFPWLSFDATGSKEKGQQIAQRKQANLDPKHRNPAITHENLMDSMYTASAYGFLALKNLADRVKRNNQPYNSQDLARINDDLIKPLTSAFKSPNWFLESCKKHGLGAGAPASDNYLIVWAAEEFVGTAFGKMFGRWYEDIRTAEDLQTKTDQLKGLLDMLRRVDLR